MCCTPQIVVVNRIINVHLERMKNIIKHHTFYEPSSCPVENVKLFKRCENNNKILHNIVTAVEPFGNV